MSSGIQLLDLPSSMVKPLSVTKKISAIEARLAAVKESVLAGQTPDEQFSLLERMLDEVVADLHNHPSVVIYANSVLAIAENACKLPTAAMKVRFMTAAQDRLRDLSVFLKCRTREMEAFVNKKTAG
jgi:hypothetical protein